MKKEYIKWLFYGMMLMALCICQSSFTEARSPAWSIDEFFKDQEGTFVIQEVKEKSPWVYNKKRAKERFAPQSTFKVANALIGLQTGAVRDEYDIKYWDGVKREIDNWNRDHTLGSGMRDSVVWYYQAMARDIGEEHMNHWVKAIHYGNKDISGEIDQFWLSSTLRISPIEQVRFLKQLYEETLPFDLKTMRTVKRMMVQEEEKHATLYGKTGSGSGIGWYVGFIEHEHKTYIFATNIEGTGIEAKDITYRILKKYHLMEASV
ncbi:BPU family class D beta-lactamase [Bacillus altitudinis]|uniref:BPU family class D beta-lactamase n=1 Tax=Bacillus pumilus TaxID=1408 RepID=UPI0025A058C0|nr:BPU family class D beta-lactamase [Bacillus pumilus]MDM5320771.1 BPU family class D beta-lactamase [Bacillus pumilus]MDR4995865.1 BPU family class D beta-lactamase [Bacillus altitudinis]